MLAAEFPQEGLTLQAVQVNSPSSAYILRLVSPRLWNPDHPLSERRSRILTLPIKSSFPPKQLYLAGIDIGTTTLTLWGNDGKVSNVFNVQVSPDVSRLKEQIHDASS